MPLGARTALDCTAHRQFAQDALRDAPARPLCNLSKSLNLTRNLILNLLTAD